MAGNQSSDAMRFLKAELAKSPQSIQLQRLLVLSAVRGGQFDLAVSQAKTLLAAIPDRVEGHVPLAEVYTAKGESVNAAPLLEKAKRMAPNKAAIQAMLAAAYLSAAKPEEAKMNYRQALDGQPRNPFAANNLAFVIADTNGDLDEALKLARQAVKELPGQPDFLDTLGYVYLKKNQPDQAIQVLRDLTVRQPENALYRYHFGMAHLLKGSMGEARAELRAAIAKRPDPPTKRKIEGLLSEIR